MSAQIGRFASRQCSPPLGNERECVDFSETFLNLLTGAFTDGRTFARNYVAQPHHGRRVLPGMLEQQNRFAHTKLEESLLRAAVCFGAITELDDQPPHVLSAEVLLGQELANAWLWADPSMRTQLQDFSAYFGRDPRLYDSRWNGIHAVVRTIRAAAAAGLEPKFPSPFEDAYCNIDLFIVRKTNDTLAVQIKAQARSFFVHTFSRNRDFQRLSLHEAEVCLRLLNGARRFAYASGIEITPTYVACGSLSEHEETYFSHVLSTAPARVITRRHAT